MAFPKFRARPTGRFVGGAALPIATAQGVQGAPVSIAAKSKRGLQIANIGAGNGYWSDQPNVSTLDAPIPPGTSKVWMAPFAPQNTIYAAGDVGADLRVDALFEVNDNDPEVV